jgi:hypothetical protein
MKLAFLIFIKIFLVVNATTGVDNPIPRESPFNHNKPQTNEPEIIPRIIPSRFARNLYNQKLRGAASKRRNLVLAQHHILQEDYIDLADLIPSFIDHKSDSPPNSLNIQLFNDLDPIEFHMKVYWRENEWSYWYGESVVYSRKNRGETYVNTFNIAINGANSGCTG